MYKKNKPIVTALIADNIVEYDFCGDNRDTPYCKNMIYLGEGVVYSYDGVLQNSDRLLHFWKKNVVFWNGYEFGMIEKE